MDAGCDGECHRDADEHAELQRGGTINIHVALLGGQTLFFETNLSATVSDIKSMIRDQLGHHPMAQTLILNTTILADSSALLKDVEVHDGSWLTLTLSNGPLGQSLLAEPDGKMMALSRRGTPDEVLNEFQLMSLQAAWKSTNAKRFWGPDLPDFQLCPWGGNDGPWSIDLHWTTRTRRNVFGVSLCDCRYEYWSTAPGDNENGALVRVDQNSVTCIGEGSDDGLRVFPDFENDVAAMKLVREGWPCFYDKKEMEEAGEGEGFDDSEAEKQAMKAIKAMKKMTPQAKKKAIKALPLNVQMKVMVTMKASGGGGFRASADATDRLVGTTSASGSGLFDVKPAAGGGPFGAASLTAGNGLFDAKAGRGLFGAAPATTGGSLFSTAPATTGGGLFGASLATTGDGLFGTAPATTFDGGTGSVFGAAALGTSSGLFGAAMAMTGGSHGGAASVTTGGGLFDDATTGGGLFGIASATTGGNPVAASPAMIGDGLFGATPAIKAGGLFGSGGLFEATPVVTCSELLGAARATTSGGLQGAASAATGIFGVAPAMANAGSGSSSPARTSPKQDECKVQ